MPATPTTNFGVVQFTPVETFLDLDRGLDKEARMDRILDDLSDEPKSQSTSNWPRIHTAIRRGDLFIIETSTPAFTALLRFNPKQFDIGDYEIHYLPRGGVDKGRIGKVTTVKADETRSELSMLRPFAERFTVVTIGGQRPHARMIWLVGLSSFRNVEEVENNAGD